MDIVKIFFDFISDHFLKRQKYKKRGLFWNPLKRYFQLQVYFIIVTL